MEILEKAGLFVSPSDGRNHYDTHLEPDDMSVGTYSIPVGGLDDQTPHSEDEIYVVKSGRARIVTESGSLPVGPGSVIFVAAGEEHQFIDITEDLCLIVVFAPPYGSGRRRID